MFGCKGCVFLMELYGRLMKTLFGQIDFIVWVNLFISSSSSLASRTHYATSARIAISSSMAFSVPVFPPSILILFTDSLL